MRRRTIVLADLVGLAGVLVVCLGIESTTNDRPVKFVLGMAVGAIWGLGVLLLGEYW